MFNSNNVKSQCQVTLDLKEEEKKKQKFFFMLATSGSSELTYSMGQWPFWNRALREGSQ